MKQETEYEEVELFKIVKKGHNTLIEWTPDTDKYQILGVLKSYTKALERELMNEWIPNEEQE